MKRTGYSHQYAANNEALLVALQPAARTMVEAEHREQARQVPILCSLAD